MLLSSFNLAFGILMAAGAMAVPNAGQSCSKPGTYDCLDGFKNIGVCNSSKKWQVAASCLPGSCVWPSGYPAPFCYKV
jgi:hypothetical protein